ncbi:lysophospholipase [Phormidium sp. CLA17]|uniref:alpha/beta fold hydrolase n=1 Tax=Leptolyngbya sp. Cla-17 TaxID=2803751 RepID=UPI0014930742|nr:lysophospholipase [Leptolyngbya sp. Cla-17]MBM0742568.1 lysophospholipase [Leptolyngbya sp. Cla-17]
MPVTAPEFVLYAQHGWADDCRAMRSLAQTLATSEALIVAPSLGFIKTWLRIEPLIQAVEQLVINTTLQSPDLPMRIVGHSLGGLIWLEILDRHPEWWSRVESIVLVGSPVGGADLARALDPMKLGLGIARDLGANRRPLAEAIAAQIPMLVIAGDVDDGSDGTVPIAATKVFGAEFVSITRVTHSALKNHPAVAAAIRQFWDLPKDRIAQPMEPDLSILLIRRLQAIDGMTDGHRRGFNQSSLFLTLEDGTTLRTWKNPWGIDHVFVACSEGTCLYSGFVGWGHVRELQETLESLKLTISS